jgi:hypothetical protein
VKETDEGANAKACADRIESGHLCYPPCNSDFQSAPAAWGRVLHPVEESEGASRTVEEKGEERIDGEFDFPGARCRDRYR